MRCCLADLENAVCTAFQMAWSGFVDMVGAWLLGMGDEIGGCGREGGAFESSIGHLWSLTVEMVKR